VLKWNPSHFHQWNSGTWSQSLGTSHPINGTVSMGHICRNFKLLFASAASNPTEKRVTTVFEENKLSILQIENAI